MTDALLNCLWRASWQGAIVIAALWCFCRVFEARRWLSADLRCWLWRGAYIKLLLGLFMAASIGLPILPPPHSRPRRIAPVAQMPEILRAPEPVFAAPPVFRPEEQSNERPVPLAAVRGEKENAPVIPWQAALAALYLLGVGTCVFRVGQKALATRHLLKVTTAKTAERNDAQITAEIARLARLFDLRQTPRLLRSKNVTIPSYAAGAVLLPADMDYIAPEIGLILAHELAHAKRRDLAWEWLGTLAQIAFFFHPLVWLARREERLCREAAADALALRVTQARAADYGKLLLSFSLVRADQSLAGVVGIVDRGTLFRRRLLCLGEDASMTGSLTSVCSWKRLVSSAALVLGVSATVFVPWSLQARAQRAARPQAQNAPIRSKMPEAEKSYQKALSNAKQLGNACMMLLADYNGVYKTSPNTFRKDVGGYLEHNHMDKNAFTSPLDKPGTQSFVFNRELQNVPQKKIKDPLNTVMAYEGAWGKPLFRYNGGAIIVFAEGHAKTITPAQAKDLVWTPQAHKPTTSDVRYDIQKQVQYARYETQKQLDKEASTAIASGDTKKAARYAQQMLTSNTDTHDWNYGNVIHQGNQILGLAALQEGRVTEAKQYLITAAINPGSPQLNSFGPNMMLAQRLLERNEGKAVVQYLDLVARFWAHTPEAELARREKRSKGASEQVRIQNVLHEKLIADWKQQIANGKTPTLNRSEQLY